MLHGVRPRNHTMDHDVIVVGAGPVGARLATVLAERGVDVLLMEEHASIGRPFQCAGLINPWSMAQVGLQHTVLQDIDGATIHGPHRASVSVGVPGEVRTSAVCRNRFDEGVVQQAIKAGSSLLLSTSDGILPVEGKGWRVHHQQGASTGTTTCRLLVGADGAHSRVRHWLRSGRPKEIMIGNQVEVTGFDTDERWLEMFTGESIALGSLHGPFPPDLAHIGLDSGRHPTVLSMHPQKRCCTASCTRRATPSGSQTARLSHGIVVPSPVAWFDGQWGTCHAVWRCGWPGEAHDRWRHRTRLQAGQHGG